MSVVQVRYVKKAIEERFGSLIDMSDLARRADDNQHQASLSRGLAALASQIDRPCSDAIAAQRVFDGQDDRGLDAVAIEVHPTHPRIFLYQAKWSATARASFGEDEVHKMLRGLDLILELHFSRFNRRFQPHVYDLERALGTGTPKITLVPALMRIDPLSSDVRQLLEEKIAAYNQVEEMVDYKIVDLRDFHRAVLGDAAEPKINTRVCLEGFGQETSPYRAMYGTMTVPAIADLYGDYRRGLFARNIRDSLRVIGNHSLLVC